MVVKNSGGYEKKRLITKNSALPKLLCLSHALRSDQQQEHQVENTKNSGFLSLLHRPHILRLDQNNGLPKFALLVASISIGPKFH